MQLIFPECGITHLKVGADIERHSGSLGGSAIMSPSSLDMDPAGAAAAAPLDGGVNGIGCLRQGEKGGNTAEPASAGRMAMMMSARPDRRPVQRMCGMSEELAVAIAVAAHGKWESRRHRRAAPACAPARWTRPGTRLWQVLSSRSSP